ncbi:hypothetical protein [Paucibacter sp. DJ2R-2]|uniref:hypothetical protein n=1 Tax=Paucibacter sp. DJ2R-2 TaxID=2893558 RepID=UPI0021E37AEB|nr:hypothetical protein [Paucibacter sp. DJ2R-2]MCV2422673.1 hypothetical protein [Paucibacter sp. DJ4R-1]MCV2438871.1 hypothetical protein [Paucibacter sp. DJ2R-2]
MNLRRTLGLDSLSVNNYSELAGSGLTLFNLASDFASNPALDAREQMLELTDTTRFQALLRSRPL